MHKVRMMVTGLVGAALVAGSIAPAAARDHRGWSRGWDRGWHRGRDDFDFGDAVGIAALIGAVAIVATSMSKDKKAKGGADTRDLPDDRNTDYSRDIEGTRGTDPSLASEDSAVDACAVAARDEAASSGGYAEVRNVEAPRAVDGGWDVDGQVEQRGSYRGETRDVRRFTCSIRDGRVAEVYISRDAATT
jgi:hypothetical protein